MPGTGKTNFLISFFEQILKCKVIVVKTADGLRHAKFFKEKRYAIIYDDLDWNHENMTREGMLHLLSGEITTTSNIKHSTVLVPKNTCRAMTSNYSLKTTYPYKSEEKQSPGKQLTCFSRRLHEISVDDLKLHVKNENWVSGSILDVEISKLLNEG